jgi:hypothetical protein
MAKIQDIDIPYLEFAEAAAPSTPASGIVRTYAKADGLMYQKDDAGTETQMGPGAGGIPATIFDAKGDIIAATAADTAARLAVGATNGFSLQVASGETTGLKWAYPVLSYLTNQLAADVAMTNANTYYDGPAVTLSVGTWFLTGTVTVDGNVGPAEATGKLWDGTTVGASAEALVYGGAAGREVSLIALSWVVVVAAGTPTWKISVAGNGTGAAIKAAAPENAAGNTASTLIAIRIA